MAAPAPDDEAQRLRKLHDYAILDTLPEGRFDDLALIASHVCDMPAAQVNFIDAARQWTKATVGLEAGECSRETSFCAHTILEDDLLIVRDAQQDPRFARNPLVLGDPHIRFYAGVPLITPSGQAVGALCVVDNEPRELTEDQAHALKALARQVVSELELRRLLAIEEAVVADLVELDRLRMEFVSLVSHEFRNPLTAIRGFSELLLRRAPDELTNDQRRSVEMIESQSGRLLELVDDLLQGFEADSRRLSLQRRPTDLAEIAREACRRIEPLAAKKDIDLRTAMVQNTVIDGDPAKLAQVIDNLLSNAVKYTPTGGQIVITVEQHDEVASFCVADSGIGIPPDEIHRLFTRFFRASTATASGIAGTGLGLVVVKTVVEAHGGTVTVDSNRDGTRFILEFPLARTVSEAQMNAAA